MIEDKDLSLMCEEYAGRSPAEACQLASHSLSLISVTPNTAAIEAFFMIQRKFGLQLRKLWSLKLVPESRSWHWDRDLVRQIAQDMDHHIQYEIPPNARWNPNAVDEKELVHTARLQWSVGTLPLIPSSFLLLRKKKEKRKNTPR